MSIEGSGTAVSALSRSLALAQMLAGRIAESAGTSSLQSPARSGPVSPPPPKGDCKDGGDRVDLSPEACAFAAAQDLSREELAAVRDLQQRDTEVRTHENAHASAGGAAAGAPALTFEKGPDGRNYAIGGEVPIEVSRGATPEETIRNAEQVRAAALAPANPSAQDRSVAAAAGAMESQARAELAREAADPRVRAYGVAPGAADEPVAVDTFA